LEPFARVDPTDDGRFYAVERKVVHIDPGAIEALRGFYRAMLPDGGHVLDLMSSWRSHLPDGLGRVDGLGMNAPEMADNPQLDGFVVHDLNRTPSLPYDDATFDAVVCAVSVQYLIQPVEVFTEVRRVLRRGAPVIVSFSNRCFPTKAVAAWLYGDDADHVLLVRGYLQEAGLTDVQYQQVPSTDDPLFVVYGTNGG
jgi:SAM-dependent methyltransferase